MAQAGGQDVLLVEQVPSGQVTVTAVPAPGGTRAAMTVGVHDSMAVAGTVPNRSVPVEPKPEPLTTTVVYVWKLAE